MDLMRVLIVEDDETEQSVVARFASDMAHGLTLVRVATKKAAMAALARGGFAMVFLDVLLPDDNKGGITIAREALRLNPDTHVVAITGIEPEHPSIYALKELGVKKIIHKPTHRSEILGVWDEYKADRAAAAQAVKPPARGLLNRILHR